MECAGNGRSLQNPKVPGIQWGKGAVGNARFSGPSLKTLLEKAGVKDSAKHVQFRGLDQVPGKVPPFIRSIPIDKAMDADTLLATHMNGAPLTAHHGFPARAVTPGWAGAASCKWLAEITLLDKPAEGNFMSPGYRLPNTPVKPGEAVKPEDTHSVTALTVKSLIAAPSDGAKLRPHAYLIQGVAWAGESSPNSSSNSKDQLPAGPMQEKAVAACSTCHEARIIVQQRLTKPGWTKEVDKMIKWGAEVDPKDRDALIDYLSANFGPDQPAFAAPRSATQSTSQTKAKK